MFRHAFVLAAALAAPAPLWAEATPQGAADLTAVLQTYLGSVPGVVNVVPEGDAYAVTLDAAPLFAMIPPGAGITVSLTPQRMRMTDRGDGTWGVTQEQPVDFRMAVPGQMEMAVTVAGMTCAGVFDAALRAFAENRCTLTGMTVDQTVTDPYAGQQVTRQSLAEMVWETASRAGAGGGVDGTLRYSATGIAQTMDMPLEPGAPPLRIEATLDSYTVDGTTSGVRTDAFYRALAWAVANPSEAAMTANKGELKAIIEAGLPLWETIDAKGSGSNLVVKTPVGPFSAATLDFAIGLNGAVADGRFREAIRLDGFAAPPGLLPPFAEGLLPQTLSIDVGVESFDAATAAQLLVGLLDLPAGQEPAADFGAQLARAFMPDGSVDIVLAPGELANATYRLTYEGRMQAGPGVVPTGTARVTATGFDAAMAMLEGAPPEMQKDLLPAIGMARGLARQEADGSLVWDIDAGTPGTLKVNGMDLMGMQ
jgi:hypothetical protein